jgi:predicted transcriptional regulator
LIGSAKQILEYRNWVAHRNPKKRSPVRIVPNMAYDTLNEIIETLLQHS